MFQGHAPAGGCLLALSCDESIMVKSRATIGLNETLLVSANKRIIIEKIDQRQTVHLTLIVKQLDLVILDSANL